MHILIVALAFGSYMFIFFANLFVEPSIDLFYWPILLIFYVGLYVNIMGGQYVQLFFGRIMWVFSYVSFNASLFFNFFP